MYLKVEAIFHWPPGSVNNFPVVEVVLAPERNKVQRCYNFLLLCAQAGQRGGRFVSLSRLLPQQAQTVHVML